MLVKFYNYIDKIHFFITTLMINLATVFLIIMVSITVLQVLMRYFFNTPLSWTEELSVYLMLWMVYLCLPYLVYTDKHIAMTIVLNKLPKKALAIFRILFTCVVIFTGITWYPYAVVAVNSGLEIQSTQLPINRGFLYAIIPVSLILMMSTATQRLFISLVSLFDEKLSESLIINDAFPNDTIEE